MKIVITGATGLIGSALCKYLCEDYEIIALSRNRSRAEQKLGGIAEVCEWDARSSGPWADRIDGAFAVINLAGENIASGLWTMGKKERILNSRVSASKLLVDAVAGCEHKPEVFLQGSAIGYYGSRLDEELSEESSRGEGFLADVCVECESIAARIKDHGVRYVGLRTGIVLDACGGALPKIANPVRFYLGGYPGNGSQWFSWIAIDDHIAAIRFIMEDANLAGPLNLCSPGPVSIKDFTKVLGKTMNRPVWMPVPALGLKLLPGKMAEETFLASQRVLPKRLLHAGFSFKYPEIDGALRHILIDR